MTKQQEIQIKAVENGDYLGLQVVMKRRSIPTSMLIEHIKRLKFGQLRGWKAHRHVVDSFITQMIIWKRLGAYVDPPPRPHA